mmetsp:Transcript_11219/g.31079  ORF Transcript_11219/g.31079 Transcript_11219/m.31079 type:complete len:82 (-) Transcript_11219:70-315(-)
MSSRWPTTIGSFALRPDLHLAKHTLQRPPLRSAHNVFKDANERMELGSSLTQCLARLALAHLRRVTMRSESRFAALNAWDT